MNGLVIKIRIRIIVNKIQENKCLNIVNLDRIEENNFTKMKMNLSIYNNNLILESLHKLDHKLVKIQNFN